MKLKHILPLAFSVLMFSLNSFHVTAQDNLNISEDLRANSIPIKIKRKGISSIGKYEFDGYKLISGKSGKTTTNSKTSFKKDSKINSHGKKSFVFINSNKDSVIVNLAKNTDAEILVDSIINLSIADDVINIEAKNNFFNRTFFKWNGRSLKKGVDIFVANFLFLKDSTTWNLTMKSPLLVDVDGVYQTDNETHFEALLSNGTQDIVIKEVEQMENTKISLIRGPSFGYEFYLNNLPVAALQYRPIDRLFIWFYDGLDESLKFVLASASTALLVREYF